MADLVLIPGDLAVFMGTTVDEERARVMLELAQAACRAYLTPLPDTAAGLVLTIAATAYSTPVGTAAEGVGPYSIGARTGSGIFLTRAQRNALRTLAGRGGAFTIDPTPADAGTDLAPWGQNVDWRGPVPIAEGP